MEIKYKGDLVVNPILTNYHKGKDGDDTDLCISITEEKPQEAIKSHNQEAVNRHSHNLQYQQFEYRVGLFQVSKVLDIQGFQCNSLA